MGGAAAAAVATTTTTTVKSRSQLNGAIELYTGWQRVKLLLAITHTDIQAHMNGLHKIR